MQLHDLKREHKQKESRRVGRGGKRGKTSGRGHKGQKARAGHKLRPEMRDTIKRVPKRRGYGKNRSRTVNTSRVTFQPVNVSMLEARFTSGDIVTPEVLFEKRLVRRHGGKLPAVKILGSGNLTKKLTISNCAVSESAKEKIEKAGGKVERG